MSDIKWTISPDRMSVLDAHGRVILKASSISLFEMPVVQQEFNLRLAAAAPEMLRVLQVISDMGPSFDQMGPQIAANAVGMAVTVLKKMGDSWKIFEGRSA